MKKYFLFPLFLFAFSCDEPVSNTPDTTPTQTIYINEFMASNSSTIQDNAGEYDDWIEIYNSGDNTYSLKDHFFTDKYSDKTKWKFPDVQIGSKNFLLIWCDGDTSQGNIHANFKLSASGEELAIFNVSGTVIDSISFTTQKVDTSFGRFPDASKDWKQMPQPTPGSANK